MTAWRRAVGGGAAPTTAAGSPAAGSSPAASSSSPSSSGLGLLRPRRLPQRVQQREGTGRWPSISLATTLYFVVGGVTGLWVARLIARRDVRDRDRRRRRRSAACRWRARPGAGALAAVRRVRRVRLGFSGAGLIPVTTVVTRWYHAALGRPVGGVDRPVGRRHRAHAVRQVADRRRAWSRRRRSSASCGWSASCRSPVARPARPRAPRLAARRRAGRADVAPVPPTGRRVRRGGAHPLLTWPSRSATCWCSAPRSAASSSSSSSSRSAPTADRGARDDRAGRHVGVARLVGGRVVSRRADGGSPSCSAPCRRSLAVLAFADVTPALFVAILLFGATGRQHPDAAAAADRRALRRPRLPADLQPLAVRHDVRGGRRPAAARLAVRQRRRLPTSYLVAAGCSFTGALVLASAGPATCRPVSDRR